jgi:uncharacterized coiled-coil protein SlyX
MTTHTAVLQTLNQWRSLQRENGVTQNAFYSADSFSETNWAGIPLILTKRGHPTIQYKDDPSRALKSCDGIVIGTVRGASVDSTGTSKFLGDLEFSDPDAERLHTEGKLTLSTGFRANFLPTGEITGKVVPDHVIVFEPTDSFRPQDMGAMFLNATMAGDAMAENIEIKGILSQILETLRGVFSREELTSALNATTADIGSTKMETTIEALTTTIAERDKAVADITGKLTAMETQVKAFQEAEQKRAAETNDALWENVKKNALLPGQYHKPEDEAKLKEMFLTKKDDFYLNAVVNRTKPVETPKEGDEFVANSTPNEGAEIDALVKELKRNTGRMR